MRADLDRLMAERNLDALLVMGDASANTILSYLTGGAHLEGALVAKRRGGPLTLIHGSMERDNAAATGLQLVDRDSNYNSYTLLQKHNGNALRRVPICSRRWCATRGLVAAWASTAWWTPAPPMPSCSGSTS